jgi:ankyrin repeat protein
MESDEEPEVESLLKEVRSGTPNIDLILNLCASNCPECDYETEDGSTILHIAVRNVKLLQHLHVVQALIAACTSFVAKPNQHGFLPIHKAVSVASDDHVPAVAALIEANPDTLTAQTLDGQTVLHLAITGPRNPSKGIVELLSQRQPLLGYTADAYGQLPLHKLVSRPRVEAELVQYLIQCNPHATSLKDSKG